MGNTRITEHNTRSIYERPKLRSFFCHNIFLMRSIISKFRIQSWFEILSDGHTIATTSRRPMTTDDHRQPITNQIFDRQSVADQLQTKHPK